MPEGKGQIGFQQIGLGGVLKQYKLVVPPNQREARSQSISSW